MSGVMMRGAGLAVVVGLTLSACTGSTPEPEVTAPSSGGPTPAVTASASPAPSAPAKPKRPEAMKRDDAQGAAAAAEYFIELYPYVMATGDTEEFEAMSHRACEYCKGVLDNEAWLRKQRGTFEGGSTDAVLTETYQRDDLTGIFPFDFATSQSAIWIHGPGGKQIDQVSKAEFDARVEVGRRGENWVVVEVAPRPGGRK
jgi:DNA-binding LacI/PurR family transcriptional regulator